VELRDIKAVLGVFFLKKKGYPLFVDGNWAIRTHFTDNAYPLYSTLPFESLTGTEKSSET
jgi:hypothetical protein